MNNTPFKAGGHPMRESGSALIEYTVVLLLLVVVLLAKPDVIRQLTDAIRDAYASFVYALSISWI